MANKFLVFDVFVVVTVVVFNTVPLVTAQFGAYESQPSGLQGFINTYMESGDELMSNIFKMSTENLQVTRKLLQNVEYTLERNAFSNDFFSEKSSGIGLVLYNLHRTYLDWIEPIIDSLHHRSDRLDDMSAELTRVQSVAERTMRELRTKGKRCITPKMAQELSNELCKCSLIPIKDMIIDDTRMTRDEVRKLYEEFHMRLFERTLCLSRPARDSVQCIHSLVADMPSFLTNINGYFSIPVNLQEFKTLVNECVSKLRTDFRELCKIHY